MNSLVMPLDAVAPEVGRRRDSMDFLIHHMLRHSAAQHPEKEALVHGPRRLTYREVADRCASVACGLRGAGMQRGDRVGIYLDPSVEQVLSIFSISQAGGVYVPINTVLVPDQVAHIARDCGMKALITTPDKLEMLLPALHDVSSLQFFVLTGKSNGQDPANVKADSRPVHGFEEMLRLPVAGSLAGLGHLRGPGRDPLHFRLNRKAQRRHAEPRQRDGR